MRLGISTDIIHRCLNHLPRNRLTQTYILDTEMDARKNAFMKFGAHLQQLRGDTAAEIAQMLMTRDLVGERMAIVRGRRLKAEGTRAA